ncbi:MAG: iron-sulfur cluster assembly accessory protein [Nitrospiraceae bacterium]|nr:MAG: iron-sulfur cluster assembly accessory protein [Nitrospiraceae bacterium]
MVTITDVAADKAKEILSEEGKADWGLRFYTAGSSCCGPSYGIDIVEEPVNGDKVIEKNGLKVYMDSDTFDKLEGMNIDYVEEGEKEGFVLTGGKPSSCGSGSDSGCGCGSSCG